jgi:hypothetical protein
MPMARYSSSSSSSLHLHFLFLSSLSWSNWSCFLLQNCVTQFWNSATTTNTFPKKDTSVGPNYPILSDFFLFDSSPALLTFSFLLIFPN